ncbi:tripartite tricarboxylate transporter TctB family protein [Elioraea tepidiphila]|uniref:tripartite tricarboxylate transporter TctB family protein n=1 Tax=Elioraea tepidiphila TaxID=457934 RepID=UPI000364A835|nr:tripartite tricarboxylate transporter TctB family protein [Elioraea tepidiphila]
MADESAASHVTPPPKARTDLITAAVLLAFAAAAFAGAWAMPTFTDRGGDPFTAPGIVPGFHAVVIGVLSLVLGVRAVLRGALRPDGGPPAEWRRVEGASTPRLALAAALGVALVFGLIGRVPFWAAAALFVASFTILFEWPMTPKERRLRRVIEGIALGIITGLVVTLVFERVFLVRLP